MKKSIEAAMEKIRLGVDVKANSHSRNDLEAGATKIALLLLTYMQLTRVGILGANCSRDKWMENCQDLPDPTNKADIEKWWQVGKAEVEAGFPDITTIVAGNTKTPLQSSDAVERVRKAFFALV